MVDKKIDKKIVKITNKILYTKFKKHISYKPVAGLTIEQAFEDAIQISDFEGLPVQININDMTFFVHKNSKIDRLLEAYHSKLDERNYRKILLNLRQRS